MSTSWSDNEKKLWDSSEVLKELEARLSKVAVELGLRAEAQANLGKKVKDLSKDVQTAKKGLDEVVKTTKNLAEDDESESTPEITEEEHAAAKAALLEELRQLAIQAIDQGDKKTAYKLERTIEELLYENS